MGFKPSEKVLVALRGVYNLPFNLDDPVDTSMQGRKDTRRHKGAVVAGSRILIIM